MHARSFAALLLLGSLAACDRKTEVEAPPRATDEAPSPTQKSLIAVPINASTATLKTALERAVPKTLWTINRRERACVQPQRVKLLGRKVKVTPPIACTIVGQVTRGPLRLRGEGEEIVVDMPLHATIAARDVGGVLKGETATGAAMAHARVRIELTPDWRTQGKARISYGWTKAPGIDFLGRRITFTDEADAKLRPVVRDVEREVNREIAEIDIRRQAADVWRQSFTALELNRENPPVWMRVTPQRILYGGYRIDGQRINLNLGLEAITETFVSRRPDDPATTPLPRLVREAPRPRLDVRVPVIADYAQLQPVVDRALAKRSLRPFELPKVGPMMVKFGKSTIYGAEGGRIAVGVDVDAKLEMRSGEPTRGRIWMTAIPVNKAGSAEVHFTGLSINGDTDGVGGDLLILLGRSEGFAPLIAEALTQNFTRDLGELQGKIKRAVNQRREGPFVIRTRIDSFQIGEIKAYGNGLYLPVRMIGGASVDFRPAR
jgi:predicted small lipoprotein YifL